MSDDTVREQVEYVTQLDVELAKRRMVTHHPPLLVQYHCSQSILTPPVLRAAVSQAATSSISPTTASWPAPAAS